jgi:hypothetical protein
MPRLTGLTEIAEHLFKVPASASVVWRFFDRRSISAVIPVALSVPVAKLFPGCGN